MGIDEFRVDMDEFKKDNKTYVKISLKCPYKSLNTEHYMTTFCQHPYFLSKGDGLNACNKFSCMLARKDEFNI